MTRIYVAMSDSLVVVNGQNDIWQLEVQADGIPANCVAVDRPRPARVYCGTFGNGLWRSDDAGLTWNPVGQGITNAKIMAVATSESERVGDYSVVWSGTEPSALYRSKDGGDTWQDCPALLELPSRPTWSFPPRPNTHHVRWILPDPTIPRRIFVAIEQGGIMRSLDNGRTWEDRKTGAQLDGHTLRGHLLAPGRIYEAAGGEDPQFVQEGQERFVVMTKGGFAETRDGGNTWETVAEGLQHHYLWGLAVDPGDPDTIVVSAARGPEQAHNPGLAQSFIYRRTAGKPWQMITEGLPDPNGTIIYVLTSNLAEYGVFYAACNRGIYRSADMGRTWKQLDIAWPERYRRQHASGMAVVG